MAKLIFSQADNRLHLLNAAKEVVYSWPAANAVIQPDAAPADFGLNGPIPNGKWIINAPIYDFNPPGEMGAHFIPLGNAGSSGQERKDVVRRRGLGIHGGGASYLAPTDGSIRLENDHLEQLVSWMRAHPAQPVESITIQADPWFPLEALFPAEKARHFRAIEAEEVLDELAEETAVYE